MCLIIKQLEPKIADKDIICYKLVKRTKTKGIYESIFRGFEYIIRQLYISNIDIRFVSKIIKPYIYSCFYIIEGGMFHSYVDRFWVISNTSPYYTALKCIIPKGAYYFIGSFDYKPSYASSQIKILEEI